MSDISNAMQDYLEVILLLQSEDGGARVTDIAKRMNVAKSSVHMALHTLADKGLLSHEHYGTVVLTKEGRKAAETVYAKHNALIAFFTDILGVDPETACKDACAAEHVLSEETMDKIVAMTRERSMKINPEDKRG